MKDMREKLREVVKNLEHNIITEKEARSYLTRLLLVSEEELTEHNLTINLHGYGIYQLRQDGTFLMEDEKMKCHEKARQIIEDNSKDITQKLTREEMREKRIEHLEERIDQTVEHIESLLKTINVTKNDLNQLL